MDEDDAALIELLDPQPSMSILDVATGDASVATIISGFVKSVIAVDIDAESINRLNKRVGVDIPKNVRGICADASQVPLADSSFDAAICRSGFHHIANISDALKELYRLLKPGARLIVKDTCSPESDSIREFITRIDRLHDNTYVEALPLSEWSKLLDKNGFSLHKIELFRRPLKIDEWTADLPADRRINILNAIKTAPPSAKDFYQIDALSANGLQINDLKIRFAALRY